VAWVVRRTLFEVRQAPRFREMLELSTFCSGLGSRWAERRVSMVGELGASVESATVWVRIDFDSGKPLPLGDRFHELYEEAAQGREVTARLQLDARPPDAGVTREAWPLRFADFDLLGHVNNAASWVMVEEALARRRDLAAPYRAELEYRAAIERDDDVMVVIRDGDGVLDLWAARADPASPADAFVVARISELAR
jgi:acyl-ACP thioesterase